MKYLITLLLLAGCTTPTQVVEVKNSVATQPTQLKLAWGDTHADWDKWLTDAVNSSQLSDTVKKPCAKYSAKDCLILTIAKMAQYESSFKPETSYKESCADSKGANVISRGLLQISQESANQKAYACNIKKADELHDPAVNLSCAVKIAVYWINKDGVFFGGDKLGLGRYWSVGRVSSKSNAKILEYLK